MLRKGILPPEEKDADAVLDDDEYTPEAIRTREEGKRLHALSMKVKFVAPAMDVRGYIITSGAGMTKQMESARRLVNTYGDRFGIVLQARDDPFFLDGLEEGERKNIMLRISDQYDKIGQVYSQIGMFSDDDDQPSSC